MENIRGIFEGGDGTFFIENAAETVLKIFTFAQQILGFK